MRFEPKSDGSLVAFRSVQSWCDFYKARRKGNFPAMLDAEIRAVAAGEKLRSILRRDGHSDDDIAALLQEHRAGDTTEFLRGAKRRFRSRTLRLGSRRWTLNYGARRGFYPCFPT